MTELTKRGKFGFRERATPRAFVAAAAACFPRPRPAGPTLLQRPSTRPYLTLYQSSIASVQKRDAKKRVQRRPVFE